MDDDKIRRHMEFIAEQMARLAARYEESEARHAEMHAKIEAELNRTAEMQRENRADIIRLTDVVMSLANVAERHDREIKATDERLNTLIEQGKATDERLNVLIDVVERKFSGSNGSAGQ